MPVGVALPRPGAEPLELLERRLEGERDADARQVAELRPETNLVLDQQAAVLEQPVRLTMRRVAPVAAAGRSVYGLDPASRDAERLQALLQAVEAELEPAPEHTRAPVREQPQAVVVGRSPPQLEARPSDQNVPVVDAQLRERPRAGVDDRACAAGLEHSRRVRC